jgi:hypothetical protein
VSGRRSFQRDAADRESGHYQLTDFEARINRTEYSSKPTQNRRYQKRDSSGFSPIRRRGSRPDSFDPKLDSNALWDENERLDAFSRGEEQYLDLNVGGYQIRNGRTRGFHFMPWWEPIKLTGRARITWIPSRSEYVTLRERQLATIAQLLEAGEKTLSVARKLKIPLRTAERRIAHLLSFQNGSRKSGGKSPKTRASVGEGSTSPRPRITSNQQSKKEFSNA